MLWKKVFLRGGRWFVFVLGLVAFVLVVSGCRGIIDDLIDDDNDGNGDNPFDVFKGVWANMNVPEVGTVKVAITEPFEEGYNPAPAAEHQSFKGSVTCGIFRGGRLDIVDFQVPFSSDNYLVATIMKGDEELNIPAGERYLTAQAKEEVDSYVNELYLEGSLEDDDTLKVTRLSITHQGEKIYDLDDDDNNEYLIFEKQ